MCSSCTAISTYDLNNSPVSYNIVDVTIVYEHSYIGGWSSLSKVIKIAGGGEGHYLAIETKMETENKIEETFNLNQSIIFDLLDEFYNIDFFNLEDSYLRNHHPVIDDTGNVSILDIVTGHNDYYTLNLKIGDYSKEVYFSSNADKPCGLEALCNNIEVKVNTEMNLSN
jgi:hypothetical protein